jgi:saccharopine dehydrogenase (NAD+, L-lysine-forming)
LGKVLVIGAGGVGSATAHKCAMNDDVFEEICIASRTLEKCELIKESINSRVKGSKSKIHTAWVDADRAELVVDLIKSFRPDIVINVALPYQNLSIMDACLETGVHYLDTANYEPPEEAVFEYKHQWAYREKYKKAGITALLGSGFDPGVTGVFCAYAQKHHFDEIHTIDILDCNAGDHGYPFATNFNPEINIREITCRGRYFENGEFVETEPLELKRVYDFPEIGPRNIYLIHHEEIESLCVNIKGVKRIRFWMTFTDNYLNHLRVLQNVGMTSIKPIDYEGKQIVPLQFLKAVLPDPASLGPRTKGKTNIGCVFSGIKDGKPKTYYVYNVCNHEECYKEICSQAVSYTTGVPAMIGAKMIIKGIWKKPGVYNIEEFDPDPFMDELNKHGLPWKESFSPDLLE